MIDINKADHARRLCGSALIVFILAIGFGHAQEDSPKIWDVKLGTPVANLPADEFVDPACGTNGGPPGLVLRNFGQFMRCRPEASGLREIWFRYDDEQEYVARARRDPDMITRFSANTILSQPISLSILVDTDGLVQGYRIFTDPHAPEDTRLAAYALSTTFQARYGLEGWDCTDKPAADGETPIAGVFVDQSCRKISKGMQIIVESQHYYRAGQAVMDPNSDRQMENTFVSTAELQVLSQDAPPK